jgi:hypothetical protein
MGEPSLTEVSETLTALQKIAEGSKVFTRLRLSCVLLTAALFLVIDGQPSKDRLRRQDGSSRSSGVSVKNPSPS